MTPGGAVGLLAAAGHRRAGGMTLLNGWTRESLLAERMGYGELAGSTAAGGDATTYTEYQVTSTANSGAGSLRDAVSSPNRWVTFAANLGEIRPTSSIPFRENLVIDGRGAGNLYISNYGFVPSGTRRDNVIWTDLLFDFRTWWEGNNPPVAAINGEAPITPTYWQEGGLHYHIGHCKFLSNGWAVDGNTTGYGYDDDCVRASNPTSGNLTVAWCHFVRNFKPINLGWGDTGDDFDSATIHHCYFQECWGRQPLFRYGLLHHYNNRHTAVRNHGLWGAAGADCRVENNIFDGGTTNQDGASNANFVLMDGLGNQSGSTPVVSGYTASGNITSGTPTPYVCPSAGTGHTPSYSYTPDTANQALRDALTAGVGPRTGTP